MKTQIQSIRFDIDKDLEDHIEKRIDKLIKIYDRFENFNVLLKFDKNNKQKNKVVEINVDVPGNRLFVVDRSETFELAFDLAVDEIKKILIKRKHKLDPKSNRVEIF